MRTFSLVLLFLSACATAPAPAPAPIFLSSNPEGAQKFEVTGSSDEDIYLMSYELCRERHRSGFEIVRAPLLGITPDSSSYIAVAIITVVNAGIAAALFARFRARISYWV